MSVASFTTPEPSTSGQMYRFDDPTLRLIVAILLLIIILLGTSGNALVIFAVYISRKLQTTTNIFIVNLALSDLITCLMQPFIIVALLKDEWPLPDSVCGLVAAVTFVAISASIVNLALIAYNRYYLITRPRSKYDQLYSRRNIVFMIIFSWLYVILVVCVPPAFGFGQFGYSERFRTCTACSENKFAEGNEILRSLLIQILFIAAVFVCYVLIFIHLRKKTRSFVQSVRQISSKESRQADKLNRRLNERQTKVTKNLFIVVCAYVCCILPYAVVTVLDLPYELIPWVSVLTVLNSCVNPLIYGFNHPDFKVAFKGIITFKFTDIEQSSIRAPSTPHLDSTGLKPLSSSVLPTYSLDYDVASSSGP